MHSTTVVETERDGLHLVIRYPKETDVDDMTDYINELSQEQTFITYQGETVSREEEKKFLEDTLSKIVKKKSIMLLAFVDKTLIGIASISLGERTSSHEGTFAISVSKKFRGKGVGRILMDAVLSEAEKILFDLRIVVLSLFEGNDYARAMYEKFGFTEYGRLPEGIHFRDKYIDQIYMYKKMRD